MNILDAIISIVAPFECLGCGHENTLLCKSCESTLELIPSRCYRCRKLTNDYKTCIACKSSSKLYAVRPITTYKDTAKSLVGRLKFYGTRAVAKQIANSMPAIESSDNCIIVPVPTATSRARQRGYDQAKLIAREFSKLNGLPYLDCLARSGQSHQVGAKRHQRLNQLKNAYRVKLGYDIGGKHLILIDDVLTTGSTLESAATCLKKSGAKRVSAMIFAQA